MTDHLSTEQIASYRERRTQPEDLLRIDDHISQCDECRQRLASADDLRGALQITLVNKGDVRSAQAVPQIGHLAYEELEAYVDGRLSPADLKNTQAHLAVCQLCTEELRDLSTFKIELAVSEGQTTHGWWARFWGPRTRSLEAVRFPVQCVVRPLLTRWRVALGLAMVAVIALTVEVARWRLAPPTEGPSAGTPKSFPTAKALAGIYDLSPEEQSAVLEAISQQRIKSPPVLAELQGKRQTLLGESQEAARFEVLSPYGEVVPDLRPVFRWQPLPGARSYSVAIFDTKLSPVQSSLPLHATQWMAVRPLKRGQMYLWQVTARLNDGKSVSAPRPPSPEAKFRVLDQKHVDEFTRLHIGLHGANLNEYVSSIDLKSHLVNGILFAQAGLLEMGEKELKLIPKNDPDYGLAQNLLESIQEIRKATR